MSGLPPSNPCEAETQMKLKLTTRVLLWGILHGLILSALAIWWLKTH